MFHSGPVKSAGTETAAETRSEIQKSFPTFAVSEERGLPTHLYRDRFASHDTSGGPESAEKVLNWVTGVHPIVTISGPQGSGKSTLGWQIMSQADSRGLVPVMVSAADLALNTDLTPSSADDARLPYSSMRQLDGLLTKLERFKAEGKQYGSSVVLIIDGIDPTHYNPLDLRNGVSTIKRIEALGIRPVLLVDSDTSTFKGPTIESYHSLLNRERYASLGLAVHSDGQEHRTLERKDIITAQK